MNRGTLPEGLLLLDKPVGLSSHDMVSLTRRSLGIRRVGHTGTLDPFASGLLLVFLGRSTRLVEYLHSFPKDYIACARLGVATTTDDLEGEITSQSDAWKGLSPGDISAALETFTGVTQQRPPDFSAKKMQGRAAYVLARRGEEVSLTPVPVTIHGIDLESLDLPDVRFRVRCSTGTYIRSLARDLGEYLGVGAHLTELRRLVIGPFHVDDALGPEGLFDSAEVARAMLSPLDAISHLPRLEVTREEAIRIQSGQSLSLDEEAEPKGEGEHAVVFGAHLLAVAVREGRQIKPRKVFSLD